MSKSDMAENAHLDWELGGSTPTRPSQRYLALGTAAGESSFTELSQSGYARQAVTFAAAAAGQAANSNQLSFGPAGEDWPQATHCAVFDAASGGNMWRSNTLDAPRTVANGGTLTFEAGSIIASEE